MAEAVIVAIFLFAFCVVGVGFFYAERLARENRRRSREAFIALCEHRRQLEAEQQRHIDWLYRQVYGPPPLRVIDCGKQNDCAVLPFRPRDKD